MQIVKVARYSATCLTLGVRESSSQPRETMKPLEPRVVYCRYNLEPKALGTRLLLIQIVNCYGFDAILRFAKTPPHLLRHGW